MKLPRMLRIKQNIERPTINCAEIKATIKSELRDIGILELVKPGQEVAITGGSRGISNIDLIIKSIVEEFQSIGAKPFIVPAMGSHGGATAEGQIELLEHLGLSEEYLGCPILSSMEVKEVAKSNEGIISYVDKIALTADHIVVVNRVKQHTEIEGTIESGMCKMICIGLGKHHGAHHYHQAGVDFGMEYALRVGARGVINNSKILCGIGIVENAFDETAMIKAFRANDIEKGDEELLVTAKKWAPKLPFMQADLLIVDEIGKEISGSGMDTKVVGRTRSVYCSEPEWPKIKKIIALDLTPSSHGNAVGIGMVDAVSKRLVDKIDRKVMYTNAVTSQATSKAAIPMYYESDREILEQMLQTIGLVAPENAKVIRIKNTLKVGEVYVSEAYLSEIKQRDDLEIIKPLAPIAFDKNGILISF